MSKRRFTPEFKREVIALVLEKGYTVPEAAEAMSVGKSTLDKWVRQLRKEQDGLDIKAAAPISPELNRIKELGFL